MIVFGRKFESKLGFSIIELAIVFVLAGLVLAAVLAVGTRIMEDSRISMTKERLEILEAALARHVKKEGDLPCPARLDGSTPVDTDYGIEVLDVGVDNCAVPNLPGTGVYSVDGNRVPVSKTGITLSERIHIGAVPVRTLNLPDDFMLDGWGNKIVYAVTANQTAGEFDIGAGVIDVKDTTPAAKSLLRDPDTALYLLLSNGADKKGAVGKNGRVSGEVCTATPEPDNHNCDFMIGTLNPDFRSGRHSRGNGANHFDDIVRYARYLETPAEDRCNRGLKFYSPDHVDADPVTGCVDMAATVVNWDTIVFTCDDAHGSNRNPGSTTGGVTPSPSPIPVMPSPGINSVDCATLNFTQNAICTTPGALLITTPPIPGCTPDHTTGVVLYEQDYTAAVDGELRVTATIPVLYLGPSNWEFAIMASLFIFEGPTPALADMKTIGDLVNPTGSSVGSSGAVGLVVGSHENIVAGNTYKIQVRITANLWEPDPGDGSNGATAWAGTMKFDDHHVFGTVDIMECINKCAD